MLRSHRCVPTTIPVEREADLLRLCREELREARRRLRECRRELCECQVALTPLQRCIAELEMVRKEIAQCRAELRECRRLRELTPAEALARIQGKPVVEKRVKEMPVKVVTAADPPSHHHWVSG